MDVSPCIIDVETAPLLNARDYLEPPDLTDIKAPSNYVKPEAIAGYIEKEKAKRLQDYETDCQSGAALDCNVGRIVAFGWWTAEDEDGIHSRVCQTENAEVVALRDFWHVSRRRTIVGFGIKAFDLRFMVQRSRLLGVPYPDLDFSKYSRKGITDLYLDLTFGDGFFDKGVMRRTLPAFCRRFDIPVPDTTAGADVPALVAAGEWGAVEAHCRADVALTLALARRLGVVNAAMEPAAVL